MAAAKNTADQFDQWGFGSGLGPLDGGLPLPSLSSSATSGAYASSGFQTGTSFGDLNVGAGAGSGSLLTVAAVAGVAIVAWALLRKR